LTDDYLPRKEYEERQTSIQLQIQAIQLSLNTIDKQMTKMSENLDKFNEILFNPLNGLIFKMDKRLSREETYSRIFVGAIGALLALAPIILTRVFGL